jgi:membrane protease subunit (stomatin/prohibitin family)
MIGIRTDLFIYQRKRAVFLDKSILSKVQQDAGYWVLDSRCILSVFYSDKLCRK